MRRTRLGRLALIGPPALALASACQGGAPPPSSPRAPLEPVAATVHTTMRHRVLRVGALPRTGLRTTYDLTFVGERATLVETREHSAPSTVRLDGSERAATWITEATTMYRGTQRRGGSGLEIELRRDGGTEVIHLRCAPKAVDVVGAEARLKRSPNLPPDYECGDRGVWDPPTTSRVDVVACSGLPDAHAAVGEGRDELLFAALPGVEWAHQNDDCVLQGGGLRRGSP